jgi:hypothetical protein
VEQIGQGLWLKASAGRVERLWSAVISPITGKRGAFEAGTVRVPSFFVTAIYGASFVRITKSAIWRRVDRFLLGNWPR